MGEVRDPWGETFRERTCFLTVFVSSLPCLASGIEAKNSLKERGVHDLILYLLFLHTHPTPPSMPRWTIPLPLNRFLHTLVPLFIVFCLPNVLSTLLSSLPNSLHSLEP